MLASTTLVEGGARYGVARARQKPEFLLCSVAITALSTVGLAHATGAEALRFQCKLVLLPLIVYSPPSKGTSALVQSSAGAIRTGTDA